MARAFQTAIVQTGYGRPQDVLCISTDHPVRSPVGAEVQIEVRAASLNPIDWQMIEGNRRLISKRAFPFVPLFDLAGVVVEVGPDARRFQIGDEVFADNQSDAGGAAESVNVDQQFVSHKPPGLGWAEAAAVPLAAQTAFLSLKSGDVGPGSRVAVIGASGGVGVFAVQIAKALGASRVVAVCSGRNAGFVRSLGADATVDYAQTTLSGALGPDSLDVVLDCVGGRDKWVEARKTLVRGGRFVTISRDEDGVVTVPSAVRMIATIRKRQLMARWGRRVGYVPVFLTASGELLDGVAELVQAGLVKIPLASTHPLTLDGVLAAIEESKRGRTVGKIALVR